MQYYYYNVWLSLSQVLGLYAKDFPLQQLKRKSENSNFCDFCGFLHFVKVVCVLILILPSLFFSFLSLSLSFFNHIRQSIGTQSRTIRHIILFIIKLTKTTTTSTITIAITTTAIVIITTRVFTTNLKWIENLFLVARQRQRNHIFKRRCGDSRPQKCDWWIPYTNTITTNNNNNNNNKWV